MSASVSVLEVLVRLVTLILALGIFSGDSFASASPYDPCRRIHRNVGYYLFFWKDHSQSPIQEVRNVEHGVNLEKRTRYYQEVTGRTATEADVRRARIATSTLQSLKFDRQQSTIDALKPLFMEVHLAYHMILHNQRLTAELTELLRKLAGNEADPNLFIEWVMTNKISEPYVDRAVNSKDIVSMRAAAEKLRGALLDHNNRLMKVIAWNYDEYEASRSMLDACTKFEDDIGKRAKAVLARLESDKLFPYLFKHVPFNRAHKRSPAYRDIKELINMSPEMADHRRWWNGNRELFAAILALSPTDAFFHYIDRVAASIPWISHPKFRAVLQFLQSERSIIIYYPDIQRVIQGDGDAGKKLEMLEMLNSPTGDIMVTTFARRLDARKIWEEMKAVAEQRGDKNFHQKMLDAEVARKVLGDLVLWHHPKISLGIRTFMDFLVFSGMGYLGYQGYSWARTPALPATINGIIDGIQGKEDDDKDKEKSAKEEDAAMIHVPDIDHLRKEDQDEFKGLIQDWESALAYMQNDPEGQKLLEELKLLSPSQ